MAFSKLGPGTLRFGETGSPQEFASRCTKVELSPDMKDEDSVPLLDGTDFQPEGKTEGSISGTFYQEYGSEGLIAWVYANAGKTLRYTFIPSKDEGMTFQGSCQIKPVKVGGDPRKENTTDFEFKLVGGLPEISWETETSNFAGPETDGLSE